MAWFIGQSVLVIIAAFLLGVGVGWLFWGRRRGHGAEDGGAFGRQDETVAISGLNVDYLATDAGEEPAEQPADVADTPAADPTGTDEDGAQTAAEPAVVVPRQGGSGEEARDDLERIEGIGPKMGAALHAAGIHTYGALADSDEATLRTAIEDAGLSFAPSLVTWAQQARLLADGDEEAFADLTRRLIAGRDVGRA